MSLATPDHGPFALGPKIGGGGMASVYLGKYVAPPGEEVPAGQEIVALKVIKGDFVKNADYEKMFLDEAQILTQLSHPNVIRTMGYGAQAGAWFIAMELLMGRSLLDLWDAAHEAKRAIPLDVAAFIAREVAHGLEHAHKLVDEEDGRHLGIVHRDVNPSNVFIGYDGAVKLIDFGLAKARKRQTKSAEGLIKGKIPYLSPEQIKEDVLDGRSDVYALGTTLWEMSTMRRLFKRESDVATVRAIQKGEVPDPHTLVENFPDALWTIIERSLASDRDKRYANAESFAADLDRFLAATDPRAALARLIEDLFPGEAEKQADWLSEATGQDRKTFVPSVPLAQVPQVEQSAPVLPSDLEAAAKLESIAEPVAGSAEGGTARTPEPVAEGGTTPARDPKSIAEPESIAPRPTKSGRDVWIAIAFGVIAGLVVVGAWMAFR